MVALDADDARYAFKPCPLQMAKEGMNSDGPPALPSADSVANPHGLGERAARQRHSAVHGSHRSRREPEKRAVRSASKGGAAIVVAYPAAADPPVGRPPHQAFIALPPPRSRDDGVRGTDSV